MYVSLDLETTGFDPEKDQVIEFGAVKFDLSGPKETLKFFVKSSIPIPPIVTHITKIKDEDLLDANPLEDHIQEIEAFIGDLPIIGHNISFDTGFLKAKGVKVPGEDFDTHILAGMLLHNLPSYSLEVISQTLGLQHTDKHRALDDAIAAMELFIELTKRFKALPEDLLKEIQQLCQKSDWPLNSYINSLNHEPQEFAPLVETKPLKKSNFDTQTIINAQEELIDAAPPYEQIIKDLTENCSPDTYIAVPYDTFRKVEKFISDNIAKIDCKHQYLSPKRLNKFKQRPLFDEDQISALIKYLIWERQTNTGLLSEVRLTGKEKHTLDKVCISETEKDLAAEPYYQKAHQQDQTAAALCTQKYILENPPSQEHKLTIIDLDSFQKCLHRELSIFLKEEFIQNTLENLTEIIPETQIQELQSRTNTLFSLLTEIFNQGNDQNEYSPRCNITLAIKGQSHWENAKTTVKGIFEIAKQFQVQDTEETPYLRQLKRHLKDLQTVFFGEHLKPTLMWLEENYRDKAIVLRRIPKNIHDDLKKFLNQFQEFKIIGENLDLEKDLLSEYQLKTLELNASNLKIQIAENQEEETEIIDQLIKELKANPGHTAIVSNSKQNLHRLTLALSQAGIETISQITSSTGKLKAKFLELQDEGVVLMTPNVWAKFNHQELVKTLYIYKIPFMSPSDPEIIALSENSQNAFMEVAIPKANAIIKSIISRLDLSSPATVRLIDSRILNRKYGEEILKPLRALTEPEIITL